MATLPPSPPMLQLDLSAAPQARLGGRTWPLAAPDALLLAWLALEGATPRERLALLLWPDSGPEAARNALRQRLFRLRKQIGLDAVQGSTLLSLAPAVAHDLATATTLLGPLTAPEAPELDAWLVSRRAALRAQARQGVESRIEAFELAGDAAAALPLALALVDADPQSEDAHRRVMRLHYLRGDRAAAMLAFDHCEQVLKHEVGAAPSQPTLALLATIEQSAALDRVPGAAPAHSAVPAAMLRPPRLIGRDADLAALQRGLAAGHVVVLVGEAGMGKSRLLQALAAARPGVLHSSGRPGDALVPYATLARALRQVLDRDPAAADPALRRALAPLLPEMAGDAPRPAAAAQGRLAPQVLALLQRAALSTDTLALDDLHFADDATLDLLQSLLAAPRDVPDLADLADLAGMRDLPDLPGVLDLRDPPDPRDLHERPDLHPGGPASDRPAAAPADAPRRATATPALRCCLGLRPPAPGSRLHGLLDALASAGPHTRLALQPLTEPQVAELVDTLALPGQSGAAIAAALHQRTGGNPLFALETLKLAWHRDGPAGTAPGGELPRPDTLAQLIAQQLARLSPAALQLARVAAVAGVDFSIPLAETLLGRPALDLADAWAELETRQVLRGDSFAHDLIHDAVLQGLPEIIARHLHGQAAAWLERAEHDPARNDPARIAAHWEAAGQRARALPALRAAAEHAHRALREGERIAFLLRAADIAQAAGHDADAFVLVRQAVEGHMNTIRQADGLPLLDRLAALARTPLQQVQVVGDRAWYAAVLGDFGAAIDLGEQALALARPLGDAGLLATLRQRLGTALSVAGRFDAALPHMRAAEPWARAHAAADELAEFQGNLAVVLGNLGRPSEAQPHFQQALALSQAHGDWAQHATQLANAASSRLDAGDVALATSHLAQAQHIVATYQMAGSSAGFIATLQAQCDRAVGRYGAALQGCAQAEHILAERNASRVPVARLHLAHVWLDLAQHARAWQVLGGPALATTRAEVRAMPARYAVRWLVLLARVQRRLRQDPAVMLADAAALAPATGWPELQLIVRTEAALQMAPAAALAQLQAVAAQARRLHLHGAELAALQHACGLAAAHLAAKDRGRDGAGDQTDDSAMDSKNDSGNDNRNDSESDSRIDSKSDRRSVRKSGRRIDNTLATTLARQVTALAEHTEALHADRALRWLAPAQALAAAGQPDAARALARSGQAWLRTTAAAHMAPEFADSFLHQHPVNRLLAAW